MLFFIAIQHWNTAGGCGIRPAKIFRYPVGTLCVKYGTSRRRPIPLSNIEIQIREDLFHNSAFCTLHSSLKKASSRMPFFLFADCVLHHIVLIVVVIFLNLAFLNAIKILMHIHIIVSHFKNTSRDVGAMVGNSFKVCEKV